MRTFHHVAPWFAVVAAALPAQANPAPFEPKQALAELVAEGTKPERRGELFARLCAVEFAVIGKELARELGKTGELECGIGWSSTEPWLETWLTPRLQALGTVHRLWEHHLRQALAKDDARVVWEILEEPAFGLARHRLLANLSMFAGPGWIEGGDQSLLRVDRLARLDPEPRFRADCVAALGATVPLAAYVDLAIEIARTSPDAREVDHLLQRTDILHHMLVLAPAPRARLARFGVDLLGRLESQQPGFGAELTQRLAEGLGMHPIGGVRLLDAKQREMAVDLQFAMQKERLVPLDHLLEQRVRGTGKVDCRSQWRSLDGLALTANGVLRLGFAELQPLLPKEWPLETGTKWVVDGEALGNLARRLTGLSWSDGANGTKWGWALGKRGVAGSGAIAVTVEQRNGCCGLAATGRWVVDEVGLAASRYGPNDLSSSATHQLELWLPIGANRHVDSFELRDEVAIAGSYGAEKFTRQESFTCGPGPLLTPDERRPIEAMIAACADGDAAAAAKLGACGDVAIAELTTAIERSPDFGVKRRLSMVLNSLLRH
jgi:hypothetical protein